MIAVRIRLRAGTTPSVVTPRNGSASLASFSARNTPKNCATSGISRTGERAEIDMPSRTPNSVQSLTRSLRFAPSRADRGRTIPTRTARARLPVRKEGSVTHQGYVGAAGLMGAARANSCQSRNSVLRAAARPPQAISDMDAPALLVHAAVMRPAQRDQIVDVRSTRPGFSPPRWCYLVAPGLGREHRAGQPRPALIRPQDAPASRSGDGPACGGERRAVP